MNPWQNPDGSDTQLMQLYKISQSGGLNPVQRTQYQQLLGNAGLPPNATPSSTSSTPSASTPTASNAVDLMKQAQQYQVQQNAPAIATLGSVQQSLPDQYAALLAEIKGAGTAATNYAIQGAGENLSARGITPDSALYNTTVGSAIAPIGLQYGGLEAQLGQGSVQTLTDLAGSIAALQAGNVPQAMNFGGNIAALQNQLQIAQLPRETGGLVYNPATGQFSSAPINIPRATSTTGTTGTQTPAAQTPTTTTPTTTTQTPTAISRAAATFAPLQTTPTNTSSATLRFTPPTTNTPAYSGFANNPGTVSAAIRSLPFTL